MEQMGKADPTAMGQPGLKGDRYSCKKEEKMFYPET